MAIRQLSAQRKICCELMFFVSQLDSNGFYHLIDRAKQQISISSLDAVHDLLSTSHGYRGRLNGKDLNDNFALVQIRVTGERTSTKVKPVNGF